MELKHTQEFLKEKIGQQLLDSYAVMVGIGGQEKLITSDNVNEDTYFDVASLGKVLITTPLVLKTIGAGKLSLDSTLEMFFDDVPQDKRGITVQQMLTHTSGIHEDVIPRMTCQRGIDAIAAHILLNPLDFAPGTEFKYSSQGMILLGFMLEKIYNMPLDGIFFSYLRVPLGLTRSRYNIDVEEKNAVKSYYRINPGENCAADRNVSSMKNCVAGSGGMFETVADINRYVKAVLRKDPNLYPEYLFDLAEKNYTPDACEGRGLGWRIVDHRYADRGGSESPFAEGCSLFPDGSFGHTGHTGCLLFINRQTGLYVILLSNITRFDYMRHNFNYCNIENTSRLREQILREIKKDLQEQNLL